jgi:hypothetical protein
MTFWFDSCCDIVTCIRINPAGSSMSRSIFHRAAVGAAAVAVVAMSAAPALAAGQAASGWRLVFSKQYPVPKNFSPYSDLTAGVALGTNDAWALGGTSIADGPAGRPVALHWRSGSWHQVALPSRLRGVLGAVSAPASNDVWAVSQLNGYVLRWNGKRWSTAKSWPENTALAEELTGVTAFSPSNVWVFGGAGAWPGLGTWHLHGRTWTKLKGISIDMASAISPSNMWAIADNPKAAPWQDLEHYNGTSWSAVSKRGLASDFQLTGILALSAKRIWVAGFAPGGSQIRPELARWDGHGWQKVAAGLVAGSTPDNLTADGHGGLWLNDASATLWAVHISAAGKVTRIALPSHVGQTIPIPGTGALWTVGASSRHDGSAAAIWLHGRL